MEMAKEDNRRELAAKVSLSFISDEREILICMKSIEVMVMF